MELQKNALSMLLHRQRYKELNEYSKITFVFHIRKIYFDKFRCLEMEMADLSGSELASNGGV